MASRTQTRRLLGLLLACFALAVVGCGDDQDDSATTSDGSDTTAATDITSATDTGDPAAVAEQTSACLTEAGLEPEVVDGELEGAVGIDLTTTNRTIVVQIFPTEQEAADYESAAGLDQEVAGTAVILGGLVPPKTRQAILDCLPVGA